MSTKFTYEFRVPMVVYNVSLYQGKDELLHDDQLYNLQI